MAEARWQSTDTRFYSGWNKRSESGMSLTNGKIIGANYDAREYLRSAHGRGEPAYVMSRSDLMEFAVCPSRWINGGHVEEETTSTEWGSLVDCLVTDSARFDERFAIKPEKYPVLDKSGKPTGEEKPWNGNSTWCKEWMAAQSGRCCISTQERENASAAAKRAAQPLLGFDCQFQVFATADFQDEDTGLVVPLKVLIDIVPSDELSKSLIDLKTAKNGDPRKWNRVCFERDYHVQSALQLDVFNAASGQSRDEFYHIVQENFSPYEVSMPFIDPSFVSLGRQKYLLALQVYAQCLKSGHWATYDQMQRENHNGHPIVSPEAWMVEEGPSIKDPDWLAA